MEPPEKRRLWGYAQQNTTVNPSPNRHGPGVIRMQFDEQIKRSQDVDLLVMVALMLGVVPQWELEFDCEPFLPMKNTTLLFQKREEYVVQIVRKYHDRGETE